MFLLFRVIPMRLLDAAVIAHLTNVDHLHCHCIGVLPWIQVPSLIEARSQVLGLSDKRFYTISTGAEDLGLPGPLPMQWGGMIQHEFSSGSDGMVHCEIQQLLGPHGQDADRGQRRHTDRGQRRHTEANLSQNGYILLCFC